MASASGVRQLLPSSGLEVETMSEEAFCDVRSEAGKEGPESKAGEVRSSMSEQRRARKP